ncbi:MAG: hypothetical protein LBL92_06370 [Propionibacteriaceae bacterium]|nr:hypothetical protein [Propionibacteriaceae bacterium]
MAADLKTALRQRLRAQRAALPAAVRQQRDDARTAVALAAFQAWLTDHPATDSAQPVTIAAYDAVQPEPDTAAIIDQLDRWHCRVLLPTVGPARLGTSSLQRRPTSNRQPDWTVRLGRSGDPGQSPGPQSQPGSASPTVASLGSPARQSRYGTLQGDSLTAPTLGPQALAEAAVILLPGWGGTRRGDRLGTGGGWYDRALTWAPTSTPRWLLLNADEVVERLPAEPWDQLVDAIITESGWIDCHRADGSPWDFGSRTGFSTR